MFAGLSIKCGTEIQTYVVEPDTATTVIVKATLTKSITSSVCGESSRTIFYTRYTQTDSKLLYIDFEDASTRFRITTK